MPAYEYSLDKFKECLISFRVANLKFKKPLVVIDIVTNNYIECFPVTSLLTSIDYEICLLAMAHRHFQYFHIISPVSVNRKGCEDIGQFCSHT